MKNQSKLGLIFLSLALALMARCKKMEDFPDEPHIEFESFTKLYNAQNEVLKGVLRFSFTDGDGDIGLTPADTVPPYEYNLFIDYYEKRDGTFEKVEFNEITLNARIPLLTPEGAVKSVEGSIEDTIDVNYYSPYDTIKLEFYIVDRALHESNKVETPEIILQ